MDGNSNVCEACAWSASPTSWRIPSYPIKGEAGAPTAVPNTPLVTDINTAASSDEVYYICTVQHTHLLSSANGWFTTDVTAKSGGPSPVP